MKKIIVFLFAVLLSVGCFATDVQTYANAGELYQAWAENFPDYICGVWSTDGGMTNLTFSVLEGEIGEAGKQEILALVEDDSTVTFEYGTVSRNYLVQVQEELLPYFEKNIGLVSSGVYEMENRIGLGILQDKKDSPEIAEMLDELKAEYGDIFFVEYTADGIDLLVAPLPNVNLTYSSENKVMVEGKDSTTEKEATLPVWCFAIAGIVMATVALVLVLRKNSAAVRVTNAGNITESCLSCNDVEEMVKESKLNVSKELDEKVLNDIEK